MMQRNLPSRLVSLAIILITHIAVCLSQDKLSGSATVSPTGAAVYSVAIEAPKGVGDLMPSIGIAYNSQAGNGLVGFGCNITGLSAITRGVKTIAHDNTVKGISYGSNCALYLDGKRLLLKSGAEGTDGCVYAPEGEPLTSVTLHGSLASTSCWFEIDTNDGMVYEYGYTSGRQFTNNSSAVAAWYISRAKNPMGQTITYYYSTDGLYLYPQTISYGGDNSVNFSYESRTDSIFFVLGNQRGHVAKRLKSISTKAGSSTYRTYTMSYNDTYDGSTTKFSRLTTIHETGENGNSNHELTAQWNHLPMFLASCHESAVSLPSGNNLVQYGYRYLFSGDMNNDGISDILHISPVQVSTGSYVEVGAFKSHMSNGSTSFRSSTLYSLPVDFRIADIMGQNGQPFVVDINGDGKNDNVFPCLTNNTYNQQYVIRIKAAWGGQSVSTVADLSPDIPLATGDKMPLYMIADLNGNGKNDFIFLEKQGVNNQYALHLAEYSVNNILSYTFSFTLHSEPQRLFVSDFNHDGLTDLMVVSDSGCRIFYNQGGSSLQGLFVNSSILNTSITTHDRMEQGDFNGDGILDLIWNDDNSSQLYFEIGNADGTFTRRPAYDLGFSTCYKNKDERTWDCLVADFDHDGKSDVVLSLAQYDRRGLKIYFVKTHTYWLLSNGSSLAKVKEATSTREDDAKTGHLFAGDFKGRGFPDVANYGYDCYNGTDTDVEPTVNIYSCSNHDISNGKVSQFQDSNGRKTAFTYASLASDLVYVKGTGSTYPLIDIAAPLCVTSQVTESGGSPTTSQICYTYKGLRANLLGRGLLDFTERTVTNVNAGKTVKTRVNSVDPIYCVPTHTTVTTTQSGMTSLVVDSIRIKTSVSSTTIPSNNYLAQPLFRSERDIYGHETTTYFSYDVSRHCLTNEFTVYDENFLMFKEINREYSPNKIAGAYRPVSVFSRLMHPDADDYYETETRYTYDSYGRKTSVTEFAGEDLELVTSYTYDSHGNVTKEKLSGYGISSDTETNFEYGGDGKFLTRKSNIAQTVSYTRNAFGDVTAETDHTNPSNPLTTTYTRNGFGTLTKEIRPTGETTTWTRANTTDYGGSYCITATSNNSPAVKTWYDALGNELRTETAGIDGIEISKTNTYNARGELTAKTSVHGSLATTESYTYDPLGRPLTSTSADGTTTTYAYDDRMVSTTKNGQTYSKYYDAWGNVTQSDDPLSSVSYNYDATGKVNRMESENCIVEIEYDACGNQTSLDDLDAGLTTYQYDALHRVICQTDARGNVTTFSYDGAGRLTQKSVGGTTTTYTYGTAGNGSGRLISEQTGDRTITYTYDNKGRLSQETRSMSGEQPLTFAYTYNSNGTLASKTYPQGVTVSYVYYQDHLVATKMGTRNICLTTSDDGREKHYAVGGTLEYGNPIMIPAGGNTAQLMGGIITDTPTIPHDPDPFDPKDSASVVEPVQDPSLRYYVRYPSFQHTAVYDTRGFLTKLTNQRDSLLYNFQSGTGNLLSRSGMASQAETFTYDGLDRLTQVSGNSPLSVSYDDNGNIAEKTGPGLYSYQSSHPHAVTGVTNPLGSISSATQTATYTPFGKVSTLSDNGYTMDFTYGPDEERWKTVLQHNNTTVRTTLYADGYERITENGQTRHFYYLDGGVIYVLNDGASEGTFYYAFTDHLSSVTRIYNEQGAKVFSAEYDAWGRQTVNNNTLGFHRGYTGHEMLLEFGLINMNGRLYDPILGRFLSPDNYVQMPDFSQSFNRYSYCLNNPLKYTDPSGELFGIDDAIIAFAIFNVASSMMQAAYNGENVWKAGGLSLLSSAASFGIGSVFGTVGNFGNELLRAGAHGVASGTISLMNGGSFGSGLAAGFISSGVGSFAQGVKMNSALMMASTSAMGGIGSWMTGGDFLQGSMQGLKIGLLNHAMHGDGNIVYKKDVNGNWVGEISEVVITPHSNSYLFAAGMGIDAFGFAMGAYASTRYYKSAWGYEIWRTSSGKVYDSNILQRQSNGKYVRGVQGIRISKELAKNSMKLPNIIGKRLGGLNIGLNAVNLYKDPTIGNVLNLGRSIGSYYSLPYAALDMFATGSYYEIQNAIENRHGLPGTYSSAVTGYYMLSW